MFLKRLFILIIFGSFVASGSTQELTDTVKVHFLYGSKPAKGYKKTEAKLFGGIKGGHVNIEAHGYVLDFLPGKNPLLPSKKSPTGGYHLNTSTSIDSTDKWLTIYIPINTLQSQKLDSIFKTFSENTPYDYAIFGMRCAAASYDVLSKIGLFPELPVHKNVAKHFYPKLLRKKMIKWAKKNNYTVIRHEGKASRKWEKDEGIF